MSTAEIDLPELTEECVAMDVVDLHHVEEIRGRLQLALANGHSEFNVSSHFGPTLRVEVTEKDVVNALACITWLTKVHTQFVSDLCCQNVHPTAKGISKAANTAGKIHLDDCEIGDEMRAIEVRSIDALRALMDRVRLAVLRGVEFIEVETGPELDSEIKIDIAESNVADGPSFVDWLKRAYKSCGGDINSKRISAAANRITGIRTRKS